MWVFVKKWSAYVLTGKKFCDFQKGKLDTFEPVLIPGTHWFQWHTKEDIRVCPTCKQNQGKIYSLEELPQDEIPVHERCRCDILPMRAVTAGFATKDGKNGADYWLAYYGKLPDYYINKDTLYDLGWGNGKVPARFAPGKMLGGDIFYNDDEHLPTAPGRIWREADINYYEGRRNNHRILYSNDGLLFVTYDHGRNYYEIVKEEPYGEESDSDLRFYQMSVSGRHLSRNGKTDGVGR